MHPLPPRDECTAKLDGRVRQGTQAQLALRAEKAATLVRATLGASGNPHTAIELAVPSPSSATTDGSQPSGYQLDDLSVDVGRRSVSRGGVEIPLPALSFDLLLALVRAAPNVLSYDQLMAQVWQGAVVNSETISQRVKLVRDALGDDPHTPRYIAGVRSRGYRLQSPAVPITRSATATAPSPTDTPRWSRRRVATIVLAASLLAVAGLSWLAAPTKQKAATPAVVVSAPKFIAVLPFADMSEDKSQESFADGMAQELIDALAGIPQLTVIGRTSSFSFKGSHDDVRVIGEKLGATHLIEGSVRRSGDRIRISAQLMDAQLGTRLWSDTYDRDFGDVLTIQDEIAAAIAGALKIAVDADAVHGNRPRRNAEAYSYYLRGRLLMDLEETNTTEARTYFEQALALDPTYAKAQEALATAISMEIGGGVTPKEVGWPEAVKAARKTLQLDPKSAMAHAILGQERAFYAYDWRGANAELDQALALQPRDPDALYFCAQLAWALERMDEAKRLLELALAIDPLSSGAHLISGWHHYFTGDMDGAERELRTGLRIAPKSTYIHQEIGRMLLMRGQPEAALEETLLSPGPKDMDLALTYHALGRKAEADAALARLLTFQSTPRGATSLATVYAYRNDLTRAFEWFDVAVARREWSLLAYLNIDPMLANVRADPRYRELMRKMNRPDGHPDLSPAAAAAPPRP